VKKIIANEGFRGFYKGTATPLVGVGACVSIQFGTFEFMKRYFRTRNEQHGHSSLDLSGGQFYLAGGAAGIANTVVACMFYFFMVLTIGPIELIRIRLQTQKTKIYTGPIDCIRKIYKVGGLRALYRGMGPTIGREGHGMG
jgi:solute carrier family 25 (mitochondrial carnitine/acylcarnitine transporter), member 20/29